MQGQQDADAWQIKAKLARMADEAQAFSIDGAVGASSVQLAGRLGQNPNALIVTDRLDVHAGLVSQSPYRQLARHLDPLTPYHGTESRLSVVVDAKQVELAVRCLHTEFGLDSDSVFEETMLSAEELAAKKQKGR